MRVMFFSPHCLIDPGSGAAVATLALWRTLSEAGIPCQALCAGKLDLPPETPIETLLQGAAGLSFSSHAVRFEGHEAVRYDGVPEGADPETARIQVLALADRRPGHWSASDQQLLLACFARLWRQFRPDCLIAYGGDPVAVAVYQLARAQQRPVLFYLHNFAYRRRAFFEHVSHPLVPSRWARDWYRRHVGIRPEVLPYVLRPERCLCPQRDPLYVTFINPVPEKGIALLATIARILARERPELRLLVVEARGRIDYLARTGVDVRALENVDFLPNVSDPRVFLQRSRLVLMPSLWEETFGLVAAEAMLNGIPVVASNRGALPETVGPGGVIVRVPHDVAPDRVQAVEEHVARPWVEVIVRLLDDEAEYGRRSEAARRQAARHLPEAVLPRWRAFLEQVCRTPS